jgi:hypothetical protein
VDVAFGSEGVIAAPDLPGLRRLLCTPASWP